MSDSRLTNFAVLMDLLNITTIELSKAISVERSYISKWRHGVIKISTGMPYFEDMVDYFVKKDRSMGNELLENLFESVYPMKKRIHKEYLKKCVRAYILDLPDAKTGNIDTGLTHGHMNTRMNVTKLTGAQGRMKMFIDLLDAAEKLQNPSVIKIFETDRLEWCTFNMQDYVIFYKKLKSVLCLGHKVEVIFQISTGHAVNLLMHQVFLELAFNENFSLYVYIPKANKLEICSIYIICGLTAVVGHCINNNHKEMISCTYFDKYYTQMQEKVWECYKLASKGISVISTPSEFRKLFDCINASNNRHNACFHSGNALSLVTMSEELFEEVLACNQLSKDQKNSCREFYNLLRSNMENSNRDDMSGLYFILDEITTPLAYPTITQYALSAITGQLVEISREQYLRHFRDTAEILLRDNRYRVFLHYSFVSTPVPITLPKYIWYKNDSWAIAVNIDEFSGKARFIFADSFKSLEAFRESFLQIYEKVSENKKDNAYVADLFMKIANGEKL